MIPIVHAAPRAALLLIVLWVTAGRCAAHEFRPAYLQVVQTDSAHYEILWKTPWQAPPQRVSLQPAFPARCEYGEARATTDGSSTTVRWGIDCGHDLVGETLSVVGLEATLTDVLVRLERLDGSAQVERLTPTATAFVVAAQPSVRQVASSYLELGIEHILTGTDHLLYIFAMLLLVRGWRRVVATMTAFTVTHSVTLSAAALGWVHVPQAPVEACIALSILFVAAEIVRSRRGEAGWTARWPWVVSFVFGLLHGFGFAGALAEVGLPTTAIPVALLFFNVGVEIGQLAFVATFLVLSALVAPWAGRLSVPRREWLWQLAPYTIGGVAAFWFWQRLTVF